VHSDACVLQCQSTDSRHQGRSHPRTQSVAMEMKCVTVLQLEITELVDCVIWGMNAGHIPDKWMTGPV